VLPLDIDVDLGALGDPHEPVKEAFQRRGLRIADYTITKLRSGKNGRTHMAYRLRCVDTLRANDATLKTECCLRVLSVGRERRLGPAHDPRFLLRFVRPRRCPDARVLASIRAGPVA